MSLTRSLLFVVLGMATQLSVAQSRCPPSGTLEAARCFDTRVSTNIGLFLVPGIPALILDADQSHSGNGGVSELLQDDSVPGFTQGGVISRANGSASARASGRVTSLLPLDWKVFGEADLRTGALKVSNSGFGFEDGVAASSAQAQLEDRIFLAPSSALTEFQVTVSFRVSGNVLSAGAPSGAGLLADFLVSDSLGSDSYTKAFSQNGSVNERVRIARSFSRPAFLAGEPWTEYLNISASLLSTSGQSTGFYDIDFANSAYLGLDLPEGVSYTSRSGLFLSAVPEPTSLSVLALGLAVVLGCSARKRAMRDRLRSSAPSNC